MRFVSTRGSPAVSLDDALIGGIAPDGGLYLPETWPDYSSEELSSAETVQQVASMFLRPFFAGSRLLHELPAIVAETFSFPIPVRVLPTAEGSAWMLELFHGPTAAFKDVGAGFLAACLSRLESQADIPLTILVATSGDTGGAVAAAFDRRAGMRVVVLFPAGRVSARQEQQLTCWSDNVLSLAVQGSFDDCQVMVKAAMADRGLRAKHRFSSANSINVGRLLPQCCYYAHAALSHVREMERSPSFVVPTGNLGNGLAAVIARDAGFPMGDIILACNANRLIADYLDGCEWMPRASIQTLASAMDVGFPSNMERLRRLLGDAESIRTQLRVNVVGDDEIRKQIPADYRRFGFAICPHTATAMRSYDLLDAAERSDKDWIMVSTAHPAKFEGIVEPLIGARVPVPDALERILSRPSRVTSIGPDLDALAGALQQHFGA